MQRSLPETAHLFDEKKYLRVSIYGMFYCLSRKPLSRDILSGEVKGIQPGIIYVKKEFVIPVCTNFYLIEIENLIYLNPYKVCDMAQAEVWISDFLPDRYAKWKKKQKKNKKNKKKTHIIYQKVEINFYNLIIFSFFSDELIISNCSL